MDTNYYKRNMQETYNALMGQMGENIGSPVVPACDTLKTKYDIKLYLDAKGKLRAVNTNPGIAASVIEYLENRDLVKPVQNAKAETFSAVNDFAKGM